MLIFSLKRNLTIICFRFKKILGIPIFQKFSQKKNFMKKFIFLTKEKTYKYIHKLFSNTKISKQNIQYLFNINFTYSKNYSLFQSSLFLPVNLPIQCKAHLNSSQLISIYTHILTSFLSKNPLTDRFK